ncbi:MAG: bifunctional riboflavin kinase/FAD synthetase [Anaerolineae bacterium]|jgi:riboflavin kinase/FMN adenylyltransferase
MRVVHRLNEVRLSSGSFVTIGVFDGVHRGHRRILEELAEAAHATGQGAIAVTFDPHPAAVLSDRPPLLLTTVGERIDLMAALGLDVLVIFPFTEEVVHTPAAGFVEELIRHLHLAALWVGPDFTLGHEQEGDIPYLQRLGAERGFEVRVIKPLVWQGEIVHSSRVRQALRRGDVGEANGCLGRPYRLSGVVIHGRGLGRDIGVPTANISPPPNRLIPAGGVYAGWARTERWGEYAAAINIGTRPTFTSQSNTQGMTVEAHLLGFDCDLYDQVLALDFVARLRDERAYPTLNALVAQLREDVAQTRALLDATRP